VLETLKQAWVERTLADLADARQLPRPLSVGRLIERRLAQLSPGALALARVASIAGVDFTLELAESVLQAGAMQFADAINELEAAQVLRGTAFAHDLVFDAVRGSVPQAVAQLTHARVAAWLEPRGGEPARIARHWVDAGHDAKALTWLEQAAEVARRALRPREQLAFLEEKSRIEEAMGDMRAALVTGLVATEVDADLDNEAAQIDARCDRLDRLAATDTERVRVILARCNSRKVRGEHTVVVELARRALRLAVPLGDAALTAAVQSMLGGSLACLEQIEEAVSHQRAALAWLDVHGSEADRAIAHGELGLALDNAGRGDDAVAHHQLACDLCRQVGLASMIATAAGNLACNRLDAGDLAAADAALHGGLQWLAAAEGYNAQTGTVQLLRALTLAQQGCYAQALANAELAVEAMRRHQPALEPRARLREGQIWAHLGQWARVQQALDATAEGLAGAGLGARVHYAGLQWLAAQAEGARAVAREQARRNMQAIDAELTDGARPDLALPLRIELADGDDPEAALAQIDAAREQAQRIGHLGTVQAAHIRAAAVATPFDPARARREALAALALAERGLGNTVLLPAELWLHAGRALLAADDPRGIEVVAQGRDWVASTARNEVPEPFREGFLRRNPANRELLALAARLGLG
jgi:tetratricopeptide (TPR) repeat protein